MDIVLARLSEPGAALVVAHEPIGWLRSDDEYASVCSRCGARIYARLA